MYQILMILSLYFVFKLCDFVLDEIYRARVRRNILSNPIMRYEYYRNSYTSRWVKKLKRMPYSQYLKTKHWQLVRSAVLKRDDNKCADCGCIAKEKTLEVHHVTYIRKGRESLEDLMTLCGDCHQERHFVSTAYE